MKNLTNEFCIMPDNPPYWRNFRFSNNPYQCQRHEVWEGRTGNRDKSIEDGLVVFTTPQLHLYDKFSIHKSHREWEKKTQMQRISVEKWCEYYKKDEEEFRERYGKLPI